MASIYRKGDSDWIWIRYKAGGKWKGRATGYRWSNMGDVRQSRLLARRKSEAEAEEGRGTGERFSVWVLPWLISKYGALETTTPEVYKRSWRTVSKFLSEHGLACPGQITRETARVYLQWRQKTAGRNTAISDLKLLAMVLDEAKSSGYILDNPLRRLGLKKERPKEKLIWTDADILKAATHFEKERSHWMRCVFYLGLFQACRLRQCGISLGAVRLALGVIQWPGERVKGGEGYTQPIDERFLPILRGLMDDAAAGGGQTLCVVPWDASLRLRRSLDRAGLEGLSHHGLRATWITRAAEAGVPESQAMAFCHHSSREVHRVYKRLSSVGIAHVPSLISFPVFSEPSGLREARCGNDAPLTDRRTRGRSRA